MRNWNDKKQFMLANCRCMSLTDNTLLDCTIDYTKNNSENELND